MRLNLIGILLCVTHVLLGQSLSNSLLYTHNYDSGIDHTNAFVDSSKFAIYLPSFQFGLHQKGPTLSSYVQRNESGRLVIDPVQALSFAEDENRFRSAGELTGFGIGFKLNNEMSIVGRYSANYLTDVEYPLEALQLLTQGNSILLGNQIDLSFSTVVQAYHQYQISYNYQSGKFSGGIGLAYLSGILDASVSREQLLLAFSPFFFSIRANTDFQINSTNALEYESLDNVFFEYDESLSNSFFSSNTGYGLELFAAYQFQEETSIKAKISGIGTINWNEDPTNLVSEENSEFSGFNVLDLITNNRSVSYVDSLELLFNVTETFDAYSTNLPLNLDLGIYHDLNQQWQFSLAGNYVNFNSGSAYQLGLAATYKLAKGIHVSTSVNHGSQQGITLGGGISAQLGVFSLWAYTGNLLSVHDQLTANSTNGSLGMRLNFGKLRSPTTLDH